jgi:mRNA-degrading endonuclease YafQ of YafQ-DinJ toxin-antitoxin module
MKVERFEFSRRFEKAYAKLPKRSQSRVREALARAAEDLTDPTLRMHGLIGARAGTVSLNAGGDLRILCRIHEVDGRTVAFLELVGTHSQLYG